jgi:hypothetical protein
MRDFEGKVDNASPLSTGILTADEDNVRFKEMKGVVTSSGIALDPAFGPDSDLTMMAQAMARYASGGIYFQDSGIANAHVLSSPGTFKLSKSYFDGMAVRFFAGATNTSATVTVNVNAIGPKKLLDHTGSALVIGRVAAGGLIDAIYRSTADGGAGALLVMPWAGATAASVTTTDELVAVTGVINFAAAEPVSPSSGASYLNTATGAGLVTTTTVFNANSVYTWTGSAWTETAAASFLPGRVQLTDRSTGTVYGRTTTGWLVIGPYVAPPVIPSASPYGIGSVI